jgi:glycosyltransferase involved in cell wall biosynthesis
MTRASYVLVTAAYNEEQHIAETLRSVAEQTLKPSKWVVVSDGSTDDTDQIVQEWADRFPFIDFVRVEKTEGHDFATKVRALRVGFARLSSTSYEFIGVLDADLSFEPDYFERVLRSFAAEPLLGIAGGDIQQFVDGKLVPRLKELSSVAGAVQVVRRACFEETGGLPALKHGGEDAAMEIAARMHGWETRTLPELKVVHFGLVGAGAGGPIKTRIKWGRRNFNLGYHPLFQLARSVYRAQERPYVVAGLAELVGFAIGRIRDRKPSIDRGVVDYLRREQLAKLRRPFTERRSVS